MGKVLETKPKDTPFIVSIPTNNPWWITTA